MIVLTIIISVYGSIKIPIQITKENNSISVNND